MRLCLALCATLFLTAPAHAAFQGPGATQTPSTIAEAKQARDDAHVVLEGNIVEKLAGHDDKYLFQDSRGDSIVIEIDDKLFQGRTVTPSNRVRISGEVDKEMIRDNEIDVKRLDIL